MAVNSITIFALNCGLMAKIVSAQTVDAFRSKEVSGLVYAGLINSVCGNVLIAASLYAILRKHLRAASNSRTSFIVRTLIAYSVETGATTSICALVCLIAYAVMQHNCIYIALYSILSKVSLNALLATLNARRGLRENDGPRGEGIISVAGSVAKFLGGKVNTDRTCARVSGLIFLVAHHTDGPAVNKGHSSQCSDNHRPVGRRRAIAKDHLPEPRAHRGDRMNIMQ
ncbi:uncharacterized protein C8Q71DRAFT_792509 [Rhodofomes roseus]|uniref:DUF6534 domain-containing protein n=1 Tax=Rhodofomes roseus TaxID=34475 RepID=A0ABQ8JXM9_9APHY|nr:uncharacterized protein C8Q71DRAFT_792509 [Rhodofomes roseus]KAH9828793.1 hypothetical protein C8Q71DRAFT_792509 [Rhodofomes roseus]